jgi:GNAT superfamily N-acetyltransferase
MDIKENFLSLTIVQRGENCMTFSLSQPLLLLQAGFSISTDKQYLDEDLIYRFLHEEAYWSKGIPRGTVRKSLDHSLCFGMYSGNPVMEQAQQVGFARVISDFATFAYLGDVFVIQEYRGRGLSKWLVGTILDHPDLQGLRRFLLATYDAHGLYRQFGFEPLEQPDRFLQIARGISMYRRTEPQIREG